MNFSCVCVCVFFLQICEFGRRFSDMSLSIPFLLSFPCGKLLTGAMKTSILVLYKCIWIQGKANLNVSLQLNEVQLVLIVEEFHMGILKLGGNSNKNI